MATEQDAVNNTLEYTLKGKLVSNMKVEELRTELELRGLKKSGVKKDLLERLCEDLNREKASMDVSSTTDLQSSSAYGSMSDKDNPKTSDNDVPEVVKDDSGEQKGKMEKIEEISSKPEAEPSSINKETSELEDGEVIATEEEKKEEQKEPVPEKKRRISLTRKKGTENTTPSAGNRKRKWSSHKSKSSVVISTDSLKSLIPGVQLASTPALEAVMDFDDDKDEDEIEQEKESKEDEMESEEAVSESKQEERKKNSRTVHVEESKTVKLYNNTVEVEASENNEVEIISSGKDCASNSITEGSVNRDEEIQSSTESLEANFVPKKAVSPPRFIPSNVIHVTNLVRPFTQNQLNQLLSKYGTMVEGGFWINKIKSHCYVTYSSVDEAKVARESLHKQRWPNTSPKILNVDFGDDEQMMEDTDGALGKPKVADEKKGKEKEAETETEKEIEKGKERRRHKGKKEQKSKEPSAANLLDKLFRKTTTEPCIYWLPLTKEQIAKRESERDERRKQRQMVLEEEKQNDAHLKGKEKEREITREKMRETGKERGRETWKEKDRERGKDREAGREKERETSRGRERKPFRETRASSPPPKSYRRSPDIKRRSRSKGRDDRKR